MKRMLPAAQLGLTLAVLALVIRHVDVHAAARAIAHASPAWVALALAMNVLAVCASTALWRCLMPDASRRYGDLWRAYVTGMFYNNLGLGTVVGDAYRYAHLARSGDAAAPAAVSVLGERIVSACALVLFAACGSLYFSGSRPIIPALTWLAVFVGCAAVVVACRLAPRATGHVPFADVISRRIGAVRAAISSLYRRPSALARAAAFACCVQACTIIAACFVMRSLGLGVSPLAVFAVVPLIALAVLTPVSIQGIGVREVTYVTLFGLVGVAREPALAAAMLSYVTTLALTAVGGALVIWSLRPRTSARRAEAASMPVVDIRPESAA